MTDAPTKPATAADDAAAKALEARREAERKAAEATGRRHADKVVGAARSAAGAVADTAKAGAAAVGDAAQNANEAGIDGLAADARRRGEEANKSLNIGSLLGGLGGLILAYIGAPLIASFLGLGDIVGTLGMIMMAIPMMIMGSSQFGDTINGWLGRPKAGESTKVQAQAAAPAKAQAQGTAKVAMVDVPQPPASIAAETARPVFDSKSLDALVKAAQEQGILKADDKNPTMMFVTRPNGVTIPAITSEPQGGPVVADLQLPIAQVRQMMENCKTVGGASEAGFDLWKSNAQDSLSCVQTPHPRLDLKPIVR